MSYNKEPDIELLPDEVSLLSKINFFPRTGTISPAAQQSAKELTYLVIKRGVIPKGRLRIFFDAEFATKGKKSIHDVFISNGTKGEAIYEHPHFLRYLYFFIYGADLPRGLIAEFKAKVKETASEGYIDGKDALALSEYARSLVRKYELSPRNSQEEFYKLAADCDFNADCAKTVREAIRCMK